MSAEDVATLNSAADVLQRYVEHLAVRRAQGAAMPRDEPLAAALIFAADTVLETELYETHRAIAFLRRKATVPVA